MKLGHQRVKKPKALGAAKDGGDEESPLFLDSSAPPTAATAKSPRSPYPRVCVLVLRKILQLFILDDCSGRDDMGGVVGFFQDVLVGFTISFLFLSAGLWLDFVGVLHLHSAHSLREGAFAMVSNPETWANIEEASGLKLMRREEFDAMNEEARYYRDTVVHKQKILDNQSKEAVEKRKELDPLWEEVKAWEVKLGLEKYCGSCKWKRNMSCDERVTYVKQKRGQSGVQAKKDLMDNKECTNP